MTKQEKAIRTYEVLVGSSIIGMSEEEIIEQIKYYRKLCEAYDPHVDRIDRPKTGVRAWSKNGLNCESCNYSFEPTEESIIDHIIKHLAWALDIDTTEISNRLYYARLKVRKIFTGKHHKRERKTDGYTRDTFHVLRGW